MPYPMTCQEGDLSRHLVALRTEAFARAVRPLLTRLMSHPTNKGK